MTIPHLRLLACTMICVLCFFDLRAQVPLSGQVTRQWNPEVHTVSAKIADTYTYPPATAVRASAEWEEIDALMVTWTSYISTVREIVRYAREECKVYIICSDSLDVKSDLESHDIPLSNVYYVQEPFNTVWCRDYGQWNVYTHNVDSLYLIDWIYNRPRPEDDVIPSAIASRCDLPLYQTILPPYDLVATGGNFMCDGWGTGFSSRLIYNENQGTGFSLEAKTEDEIDTIMKEFMGIQNYIMMETLPYDEIHHIDMHMKLLDEETLLVGEYPTGVADGPQIEENLQYILDNYTSVFGTPYKVVRIPMPPGNAGTYPDDGGPYRTYTNFVFVNKTILMPQYAEEYDSTAIRILQEAMPGYRIVPINCNTIINALGAIHCITKEVADSDPLLITHQPLSDTENTMDDYIVSARILHRSGIQDATIYWTADTTAVWNTAEMTLADAATDTWTGSIPAHAAGAHIFYYIHADAQSGKEQVRPITAPEGYWDFRVTWPVAVNTMEDPHDAVALFPNPVSDILHLMVTDDQPSLFHYAVCDMSGRILLSDDVLTQSGVMHIEDDLRNIAPGAYILYFSLNGREGYWKFIRQEH